MDLTNDFNEGSIVISPYGLSVIVDLFDEPLKLTPEKEGDDGWPKGQPRPDMAAARIWVNGHGEETIEIDQLVPATPETMARWNFQINQELLETFQQIRDILDE